MPQTLSADEEVAHQLTLHLGLTRSRDAQTVGRDADTDARADCREAITNDLQRGDCECKFHDYLLWLDKGLSLVPLRFS